MSDTSMDDSSSYQDIDGLSFLSSLLGAPLAPDLAPVLLPFPHIWRSVLSFLVSRHRVSKMHGSCPWTLDS